MLVPDLSLTEQRIVSLLAAGRSKQEAAACLGLEENVLDWHLARARRKLERAASLAHRIDEAGAGLDDQGGYRHAE